MSDTLGKYDWIRLNRKPFDLSATGRAHLPKAERERASKVRQQQRARDFEAGRRFVEGGPKA